MRITLTITNYNKVGTKWVEENKEIENINEEFYTRCVNDKTMKNMGGYERHDKGYTCKGNVVTKITSISPNKTMKTVRHFEFI